MNLIRRSCTICRPMVGCPIGPSPRSWVSPPPPVSNAPGCCNKRGIIQGYRAQVSLRALNRSVQAMVFTQVRPLRRDVVADFERSVTRLPEVVSVYTMAGSDDFLVHVTAQDIDHLHAFLLDQFTNRREIVSFRTSIIYQHLTNPVLDPLPTGTEHL